MKPTRDNADRVFAALMAFGAPLTDLSPEDLSTGTIFQIGVAPIRMDVITAIDGVDFESAWTDRVVTTFAGEAVGVLSREHLIRNKKASGRDQDLLDVKWLESHLPR